jgi:sigma-B regulation protein RsbU (phosphoserine phosphatase)
MRSFQPGAINAERDRIDWVRAGHEPAWEYDPIKDCLKEFKGPGMAWGIDKEFSFRSNSKTDLAKGQLIIAGTDGIWEGHNIASEMFGKKRLQEIIHRNTASSAIEN